MLARLCRCGLTQISAAEEGFSVSYAILIAGGTVRYLNTIARKVG
jgi:hypothetical protein